MITDFERLQVVWDWKNNQENSDKNIAKRLNMKQSKVYRILEQHLNGKHRVEWVEIESSLNEKKG